jgi:hypothetical protein
MAQAAKEQLRHELEDEAGERFGGEIDSVMILPRGVIRVLVEPRGSDGHERPLRDFERARRPDFVRFRDYVRERVPTARKLEFTMANDKGSRSRVRPVGVIIVPLDKALPFEHAAAGAATSGDLTPVMARLGAAELEIVDTLVSAGIAANRAEAIRWSLGRIGERPAYAQLRERTREIERLKSEF